MKIVGVIPSRYESTRFPGKPLALICGKPMIYWVYQQALKVTDFEKVLVATDSDKIADVCREMNIEYIMTSLAHQTGTDRLGEVAEKISADFYVNVQGDEPLIEPETIQSVIDFYKTDPGTQIINTRTPIRDASDINDDTVVKVVSTDNSDLIYLSRSAVPYPKKHQEIQYYRHLGLYGLTPEALAFFSRTERGTIEKIEDIEMMRFMENGYRIKIVTVESSTVGVDKPEDIAKVEEIMRGIRLKGKNGR